MPASPVLTSGRNIHHATARENGGCRRAMSSGEWRDWQSSRRERSERTCLQPASAVIERPQLPTLPARCNACPVTLAPAPMRRLTFAGRQQGPRHSNGYCTRLENWPLPVTWLKHRPASVKAIDIGVRLLGYSRSILKAILFLLDHRANFQRTHTFIHWDEKVPVFP